MNNSVQRKPYDFAGCARNGTRLFPASSQDQKSRVRQWELITQQQRDALTPAAQRILITILAGTAQLIREPFERKPEILA